MRRKSTRNAAQKATPDKPPKETETPPKTRRSRRRKRSPSKSSDSEEEVITVTKRAAPEETPDTTTKSHTPSEEETAEEPVWKVKSAEDAPKGEIQKLKICLTRPSPDSPEKSKSSSRRSKSNSQTEDDATSSEDKSAARKTRSSRGSPSVRNDGLSSQEGDEDVEEKKGKGKSKGKHKSKIEKSPHLSETELQTNNEISENVQVTPQSPSIDKPVDNENDRKVDVDDIQNVSESVLQGHDNGEEPVSDIAHDSANDAKHVPEIEAEKQKESLKDSDDDEPLSVIQKSVNDNKSSDETETTPPEPDNAKSKEQPQVPEKLDEIVQQNKLQLQDESPEEKPTENENAVEPEEKPTEVPVEEDNQESVDVVMKSPEKAEVDEVAKSPERPQVQEVEEPPQTEDVVPEVKSPQTVVPEESTEIEPPRMLVEETVEKDASVESGEVNQSNSSDVKAAAVTTMSDEAASTPISEEKPEAAKERNPSLLRLKRNTDYPKPNSKELEEKTDDSSRIKPSKFKRKWESDPDSKSALFKIDLDSIQTVWPTIDFPEEPDLHLEVEKERRKSVTVEASSKKLERKVSVEYKSDFSERPSFDKQTSVGSATTESEDNSNIIAQNRKISIVDDTASKLKPPPSPAKNPTSSILFITNLVRPFTVKQLKELLERTGKIQEEGFWTDRIKSKCYVQYDTEEEAEATRNALHGVQWPIGNGKKLMIDYASEGDMQIAKNPPAPPAPAPVEETKIAVKENLEPVEIKSRPEEKIAKEVEKKRPEVHVREWDIGKKDVRKDRSRSRERGRKHRRSPTPTEDFITRKQRKNEESVPQKLMDDLFLKTKATPSIYWQPLSPEEISMKQQQRLIRMEEHKRRMEETSRMKGREMGRGGFRRRYD